jgi:hypothetical protein
MKSSQIKKEVSLRKFSKTVANKVRDGFKVVEHNEKLSFAVLMKDGKEVNHNFNFMMFCATFGLWTVPWIYKSKVLSKTKKIVVAIDDEGNTFEEKCFVE